MNWQQVCEDKSLADLPYKIELNRHGQILMSPARSKHSIFHDRIQRHLNALMKGGESFPECAMDTSDGTKVPDVVWASETKLQKNFDLASWPEAPEICVEVLSYTNTDEEMEAKRHLYFEGGAVEVWLCSEQGQMTFFAPKGQLAGSALCPDFPASVAR
jgi:Uma2 family endonuclease